MFACCESSIGAPCGHRTGGQVVNAVSRIEEGTADALSVEFVASDKPYGYNDFTVFARRRGKVTGIADLTIYWDGRIYAKRHMDVCTSVDYADWSSVNQAAGGDSETYYAGLKMAGNPE